MIRVYEIHALFENGWEHITTVTGSFDEADRKADDIKDMQGTDVLIKRIGNVFDGR